MQTLLTCILLVVSVVFAFDGLMAINGAKSAIHQILGNMTLGFGVLTFALACILGYLPSKTDTKVTANTKRTEPTFNMEK